MIQKLWNWWRPSELEDIEIPQDTKVTFILNFREMEIGRLILDKGKWEFYYSKAFKEQTHLAPLIDFPDKSKTYNSEYLWPFFVSRIPGLNQPIIQQILVKDNIDGKNEVELLKRFGKHSISNPFVLEPELA